MRYCDNRILLSWFYLVVVYCCGYTLLDSWQTTVDTLVQRHRPAAKKESRRRHWYWWGRGHDDDKETKATTTTSPAATTAITASSASPQLKAATTTTRSVQADPETRSRASSHASTSTVVDMPDSDVTAAATADDDTAAAPAANDTNDAHRQDNHIGNMHTTTTTMLRLIHQFSQEISRFFICDVV